MVTNLEIQLGKARSWVRLPVEERLSCSGAASALSLSENVQSQRTSLQADSSSCYCFCCTASAWDLVGLWSKTSITVEVWIMKLGFEWAGACPHAEKSFVSRYLRNGSQDRMEGQVNLCLFSVSVWSQKLPQGFKDFGDGLYDVTRGLYFLASRGFPHKQV